MAKFDEITSAMRALAAAGTPPYSEQVFVVHSANGSRRLIVCSYTSCVQPFADLYSTTILSVDGEGEEISRASFLGEAPAEELFDKARLFPLQPLVAKLDVLSGRPVPAFYAEAFEKEAALGGFDIGSARTVLGLSGIEKSPSIKFMRDVILLASGQDPLAYPLESVAMSRIKPEVIDRHVIGEKSGLFVRMSKDGAPVALAQAPLVMPSYQGLSDAAVSELAMVGSLPVYHMTDLFSDLYLYKYSDPDFKGMPGYNARFDYSRLPPEQYSRNLFLHVLKQAGESIRLDRSPVAQPSTSKVEPEGFSSRPSLLSKLAARTATSGSGTAPNVTESMARDRVAISMPEPPVEAYDSSEFAEDAMDSIHVTPDSFEPPADLDFESLRKRSVPELRRMGVPPVAVGAQAPVSLQKPKLSAPKTSLLSGLSPRGTLKSPAAVAPSVASPSTSKPLFERPAPASDKSPFERRPNNQSSPMPKVPAVAVDEPAAERRAPSVSKSSSSGFLAKLKSTKPTIEDTDPDSDPAFPSPSPQPKKNIPAAGLGL